MSGSNSEDSGSGDLGEVAPSRDRKFDFRRLVWVFDRARTNWSNILLYPLRSVVPWSLGVCRAVSIIAQPQWPGGPCRPAGEKTPPTATLLIKILLVHPR